MQQNKEKIIDELKNLVPTAQQISLTQSFATEPERLANFSFEAQGVYCDFSKNHINQEIWTKLLSLLKASNFQQEVQQMFDGAPINRTENRSVLHTLLRTSLHAKVHDQNRALLSAVHQQKDRMLSFADSVYTLQRQGPTGKSINQILHIGIGGSDLGPRMAVEALHAFGNPQIDNFFLSNVDPCDAEKVLPQIDAERCLFVIASKTFSTQETMANAQLVMQWYKQKLGSSGQVDRSFVGLTNNTQKATEMGLNSEQIFPMWDWVGGRFSLPSCIGLSLAMRIGSKQFVQFLKGMEQIDQHFLNSPLEKNIPVVLALLGYWYRNYLSAQSYAVLPYSAELKLFPAFLQQLEMESNGKNVNRQGQAMTSPTCPVLWGGAGTDSQHSFFQLLHQGTLLIPCDFIGFEKSNSNNHEQHQLLLANFIAQQQALAVGRSQQEVKNMGVPDQLVAYKSFPGNRPSTCLLLERLNPESLGKLIAIYEHKVFTQGLLWDVFSFDQWGVELGKELANQIHQLWQTYSLPNNMDESTRYLIKKLNPHKSVD